MSVQTKRTRDANGAIAKLDLTDASAANRRLDVKSPGSANAGGSRLIGFSWKKSTAVATDVEIFRVDAADADRLTLVEKITADASTDGVWRPAEEEMSGSDVDDPKLEKSVGWRLQFGVALAACLASVVADFKAV